MSPLPSSNKRGPVVRQQPIPEQLRTQLIKTADQIAQLARKTKQQFNRLDRATRRKVIAGLSGALALLALRAHHRRAKRRRGKKS